jgi:polar amino acid transport system substrate-binding protein
MSKIIMLKIKIVAIGILFTSLLYSLSAKEYHESIVFSFGSHNGAPYAFTSGDNLVGGIIWDIAHELADALNVRAEFINIPRKRQANFLEKGEADIILISNPEWLSNKDSVRWSEELFKDMDILVTLADSPLTINFKQDLFGLNIGTIRGYKYPLIDNNFAQQQMIRLDVRELHSNFEKLLLKRVDTFIDSSILINYQLSKREDVEIFRVEPLRVSNHRIYAAISAKSSIPYQKILAALKKLKKNGVIEAILHKYK